MEFKRLSLPLNTVLIVASNPSTLALAVREAALAWFSNNSVLEIFKEPLL